MNPRQSQVKSVYKTHIDAIHFRKTDEKRLHGVDEDGDQKLFTKDRVAILKELAAKPDVYERLSSALAPSIYEHEDIKKVCFISYWLSLPRLFLLTTDIMKCFSGFELIVGIFFRAFCCSYLVGPVRTSLRRVAGTFAQRSTSSFVVIRVPVNPSCSSTCLTSFLAGSTRPGKDPVPSASQPM